MLIRSNGAYIVKKNSYSGKKWLLKVYAMYEVQHLKVSLLKSFFVKNLSLTMDTAENIF